MGASKRSAVQGLALPQEASKKVPSPPPGLSGMGSPQNTEQRSCLTSQLRKTKICVYHLKGDCKYGNKCAFAHSCTELQSIPDLRKTRLCQAYELGQCNNKDCSFAHGEEELRSINLFYKKTLCIWNQKGKCRNGEQCRFAHGTSELRTSPPGLAQCKTLEAPPPPKPEARREPRAPKQKRERQQDVASRPNPREAEPMKVPLLESRLSNASTRASTSSAGSSPKSLDRTPAAVPVMPKYTGGELEAWWQWQQLGAALEEKKDVRADLERLREDIASITQQVSEAQMREDGQKSATYLISPYFLENIPGMVAGGDGMGASPMLYPEWA